jgi:hypothetical protein
LRVEEVKLGTDEVGVDDLDSKLLVDPLDIEEMDDEVDKLDVEFDCKVDSD